MFGKGSLHLSCVSTPVEIKPFQAWLVAYMPPVSTMAAPGLKKGVGGEHLWSFPEHLQSER